MFTDLTLALENIESRTNKKTKEEFQAILDKEDIDYSSLKVIHFTGTNGKGSTLNYTRAFLMELGYTVGSFTSPYMIKHNDRICINGNMIEDAAFLSLINQCYPIITTYDLSMFEADVLMMLVYFKQQQVDYVLVEVGIGGLTDKTNVMNGMINVITSIGHDHLKTLGPSLKDVARHKAGIIKDGSQVVVPRLEDSLLQVVQDVAVSKYATLHIVEIPKVTSYPYQFDFAEYVGITLENVGSYQVNNFLLALQTSLLLNEEITQEMVERVASSTYCIGRFERIGDIYIDGAHNIDGIRALIETLRSMNKKDVGIIFSALKDKEYQKMVTLLLEEGYCVYVCSFEDARALNDTDIHMIHGVVYKNDISEAYRDMQRVGYDMIVITGSLHFISDVRKKLLKNKGV